MLIKTAVFVIFLKSNSKCVTEMFIFNRNESFKRIWSAAALYVLKWGECEANYSISSKLATVIHTRWRSWTPERCFASHATNLLQIHVNSFHLLKWSFHYEASFCWQYANYCDLYLVNHDESVQSANHSTHSTQSAFNVAMCIHLSFMYCVFFSGHNHVWL